MENQPATEYHGDISLRPGKHKVVVEYYEEAGALITVYWGEVPVLSL